MNSKQVEEKQGRILAIHDGPASKGLFEFMHYFIFKERILHNVLPYVCMTLTCSVNACLARHDTSDMTLLYRIGLFVVGPRVWTNCISKLPPPWSYGEIRAMLHTIFECLPLFNNKVPWSYLMSRRLATQRTLHYQGPKIWNDLPHDMKTLHFSLFKRRLKDALKIIYSINSNICTVLLML